MELKWRMREYNGGLILIGHKPSDSTKTEFNLTTIYCLLSICAEFLSSRLLSKNIKTKIYRTIILQVVLYGCETWSLTLRKEYRLRVFENRVLRRIFGPKRDEVTEE
jgi:hypothetical protein